MTIPAECDYCGQKYKIQDRFAGEELPCKQCGEYFFVPDRTRRPPRRSQDVYRPSDRTSGNPQWPLAIGIIAVMLIGCGLLLWSLASKNSEANAPAAEVAEANDTNANPAHIAPAANTNPGELFLVSSVPVPNFPAVLPPAQRHSSGAEIHFVDLKHTPGNGTTPGSRMAMRIYSPAGSHAEKSLGCVLVAPAGSNLLRGNPMDADDYHAETLPYVNAGYAVVFYSIDGILDDPDNANDFQFLSAYKEFKAAQAGVVNGRNALELVLARMPAVDPERIYCAGHSSAGVLSLLLAEHEPRINGCIAYAAASDVEMRLQEVANDPGVQRLLPDLRSFLKQSSPKTHAKRFECPVFLFHALDDSNEPAQTSEAFAAQLRAEGKTVVYRNTPWGDHYDAMVERGIPAAIDWLKTLPTEQGKNLPIAQNPPVIDDHPPIRVPDVPQHLPPFQPPMFQPPAMRPPIGPPNLGFMPGQRIMIFDLESYSGQLDASQAARQVLFRFPFCDPHRVQVDLAAKEMTIGLRGVSVNSGPIKSALEEVGFQLGGVQITTYRP